MMMISDPFDKAPKDEATKGYGLFTIQLGEAHDVVTETCDNDIVAIRMGVRSEAAYRGAGEHEETGICYRRFLATPKNLSGRDWLSIADPKPPKIFEVCNRAGNVWIIPKDTLKAYQLVWNQGIYVAPYVLVVGARYNIYPFNRLYPPCFGSLDRDDKQAIISRYYKAPKVRLGETVSLLQEAYRAINNWKGLADFTVDAKLWGNYFAAATEHAAGQHGLLTLSEKQIDWTNEALEAILERAKKYPKQSWVPFALAMTGLDCPRWINDELVTGPTKMIKWAKMLTDTGQRIKPKETGLKKNIILRGTWDRNLPGWEQASVALECGATMTRVIEMNCNATNTVADVHPENLNVPDTPRLEYHNIGDIPGTDETDFNKALVRTKSPFQGFIEAQAYHPNGDKNAVRCSMEKEYSLSFINFTGSISQEVIKMLRGMQAAKFNADDSVLIADRTQQSSGQHAATAITESENVTTFPRSSKAAICFCCGELISAHLKDGTLRIQGSGKSADMWNCGWIGPLVLGFRCTKRFITGGRCRVAPTETIRRWAWHLKGRGEMPSLAEQTEIWKNMKLSDQTMNDPPFIGTVHDIARVAHREAKRRAREVRLAVRKQRRLVLV